MRKNGLKILSFVLIFTMILSNIQISLALDSEVSKKKITAWQWQIDEKNSLKQNEENWELIIEKANDQEVITEESIEEKLPDKILATLESEEVENQQHEEVDLAWDFEEYSQEKLEKEGYTIKAILPEEYELLEDIAPIEVVIKVEAKKEESTALKSSDFDKFIAPGEIEVPGTIVNVYDYWLHDEKEKRFAQDNRAGESNSTILDEEVNAGINKDHTFKFCRGGKLGINHWCGTGKPSYPYYLKHNDHGFADKIENEIFHRTLEDGYPVLREGNKGDIKYYPKDSKYQQQDEVLVPIITEKESMAYLYDDSEHPGKAAWHDVEGLLRLDDEGYYYYDSNSNFAYFDEEKEKFNVYNSPGITPYNHVGEKGEGQFFPFNSPKDVWDIKDSKLVKKQGVKSRSENVHHYLGLNMVTRFAQKNGGKTYKGKDLIYEFEGDDDVLVYIDDVLVADLSGIHDRSKLSINFHSGEVEIESFTGNKMPVTTIKKRFEEAGVDIDSEDWNGNTFADNTNHTLKFFYLERGNQESNLKLKFNLLPIPESEIVKVEQQNNPLPGAEFSLYKADRGEQKADGTYDYTIIDENPIWTGVTNENGRISILDEETGAPLTFDDLYRRHDTKYFILRETKKPVGYHKGPDTYLAFDPKTQIVLSNNYWTTGSYANPVVVTHIGLEELHKANIDGTKGDSLGFVDENPEIYGVAFKRKDMKGKDDDPNNWVPVSGSLDRGWKIWDSRDDVVAAIEHNKEIGSANKFTLTTDGTLEVKIKNLPGDFESYYWYQKQQLPEGEMEVDTSNVEYNINYYIKKDGEYKLIYSEEFFREFGTDIAIPNLKSYVTVEKLNENNEKMGGATFSLYKASDVKGYLTDNEFVKSKEALEKIKSITPYDSGKTNGDKNSIQFGYITFPISGKILEKGEYYIIETDIDNKEYKLNNKATHVIVDDNGVFVDAGTEDDNVSTYRGISTPLRSMFRFVEDDGIDATLHNIKLQTLVADEYKGADTNWSKWDEDKAHHLYYDGEKKETKEFAYRPTDPNGTLVDTRLESGWGRLSIRQCPHNDEKAANGKYYTANGSAREDLGTMAIGGVFATMPVVVVKDEPNEKGDISITKEVTGSHGDKEKGFTFIVTLDNKEINGKYGEMTFEKGVATVTLKDGETKEAKGLPADVKYEVKEKEADQDGYETTAEATGGKVDTKTDTVTGEIEKDKVAAVKFVNKKEVSPVDPEEPKDPQEPKEEPKDDPKDPSDSGDKDDESKITIKDDPTKTGDDSDLLLWIVLLGISGIGGTIAYKKSKEKNK